MMVRFLFLSACVFIAGCAGTNTIRTSADTAIVQASAAPICGGTGAANVAQKQAAIETIKAGYDRYIIFDSAAANNVSVTQMPGRFQTTGTAIFSGNMGTYHGSTTYVPGPTIVAGSHDQSFAIKMFREGEPYADQAISARQILGPKWAELVKAGSIHTCT